MDELDEILVEQLHAARKSLKTVKRHLNLMPNDPWLNSGVPIIEKKIEYLESMIQNKNLIKKRKKKQKECNSDVLTRSMIYTWYRDVFFISTYGYRIFLNSAQNYLSILTKNKKDKN